MENENSTPYFLLHPTHTTPIKRSHNRLKEIEAEESSAKRSFKCYERGQKKLYEPPKSAQQHGGADEACRYNKSKAASINPLASYTSMDS